MTEITFGTATPIDGYGPGFFRVGGQPLYGAVLVNRAGARVWDGYGDPAPILALRDDIDILLLGTGREIFAPPVDFVATLSECGVAVETMSSPTAARTYNVLLAEGRRIAAALMPVG